MSATEPMAVRARAPEVLEQPPAHLELSWRPLRHSDASGLHALIRAGEEADAAHQRRSYAEVLTLLGGSWKDLGRDSLAGFDHEGTMRAYGLVEVRPDDVELVRALLHGGVHPAWRGRGIGRAVLTWAEGRGRQKLVATGRDVPARLAVVLEDGARDQRALYAAAGFSPIRWYTELRRDLREPLPTAPPPPAVRVEPWSEAHDDQVRLAHNVAFADHWGVQPISAQAWGEDEPHFEPRWSFVALADGVVGFLLSSRYQQDWAALGYTFGYTTAVGVLPDWRAQGVGTALLVRAMAAYQAAGMDYASLRVDKENTCGAGELYERLGYRPSHGYVMYSVEI